MELESIIVSLQEHLGEKRYSHSLRVAQTARSLAINFGENDEKAYLAGLLHDCSKAYSADEILLMAKKWDWP